jgi:hypothetical protein
LGVKQQNEVNRISFLQLERALKINDVNRSFLEQFYSGQSLKLLEENTFVANKKAIEPRKRGLANNGHIRVNEKDLKDGKNNFCHDELEGINNFFLNCSKQIIPG